MRLRVQQGERVRQVTVGPGATPGALVIALDDVSVDVDVRDLGNGRLSLRLADGSMHDVVVETTAAPGARAIAVDGLRLPVSIAPRTRRGGAGAGAASGPLQVIAPMPGRIVRVPVAPGDSVEARQPVVVIEAMKMENALAAGRAGIVREVLVQEGQSVEAGRPLVVVE